MTILNDGENALSNSAGSIPSIIFANVLLAKISNHYVLIKLLNHKMYYFASILCCKIVLLERLAPHTFLRMLL